MGDHRADRAFERRLHTVAQSSGATRTQTDSLGSQEIPADAYWGINVSRALDNFAISGRPISEYPDLIFGYACVKQAAARANAEIGALERAKADLIDRVCEAAMATLRTNCITGITANPDRLAAQTSSSVGVITALIPRIGYAAASKLAKEALATNANIADLVVSSGLLTRDQVGDLLTPERLTRH